MNDAWKFSELKYARPDLRVYQAMFEDSARRVEEATEGEEVLQTILEVDEMSRRADDLVRVALIRNTMDTKNPFYMEQQRWFDENMIYYDEAVLKFKDAVYNSAFRGYIEEMLGAEYFIDADIQRKTFSEDCIELYQKEGELATEYQAILESIEVEILGENRDLNQLKALFGHEDRSVRKEAFDALAKHLKKNEARLEEIWDGLIKVRNQIGQNLGHENYITAGYLDNRHLYYTPEDVEVFRNQVVGELVPLCEKLYKAQQERLGLDELMTYDEKAVFPGGNIHGIGNAEEMMQRTAELYHALSPETGEFIDFMLEHELIDYEDRPGKASISYGIILLAKKAPFVFTRFNGTSADFQVATGDIGEAFVRYVASNKQQIKEYYDPSTEVLETYALSMGQFAYDYAEILFGDEADKCRFYNMQDLISVIVSACLVDEFEHICYANPDLTPKERTAEWRRLEKKYMPWRKYDEEFMERGGYWYSVPHIFIYPLYYIGYSLARVHALEMKKKYAEDPKGTWQNFMELIEQGGKLNYKEIVEKAGLTPLFQEGAVKQAMSYAKEVMEEYLEKPII